METSNTNQPYLNSMKNYEMPQENKDFLYNLSSSELQTLQTHSSPVDNMPKAQLPLPTNMPLDVLDAYVIAMNTLQNAEKFMVSMLSFDLGHIKSILNDKPYNPTIMDYEYLKYAVENMLNPNSSVYTSPEIKVSVQKFWNAFESNYMRKTA